ncbi:MAG TPA: SH3 domain-containing protein [Sedimentisphaerales bacterium]|nr:SH3 domain-containing protein [Sedimentisphaerales bacterium]
MRIKVLLVLLALCAGVAVAATQMSVQVQKCVVRAKPNAMGARIVELAYGDRIDVGSLQNGWYPVTVNGVSGWVPASSLSTKKIVMRSGTGDAATGASSEEVAMAGKGFNKQVEDEMQAQGKLDYTWVKKMYDFTAKEGDIVLFRAQGSLTGGGQ